MTDRDGAIVGQLVEQIGVYYAGDAKAAIGCLASATLVIAAGVSEESERDPAAFREITLLMATRIVDDLAGKRRAFCVCALATAMDALVKAGDLSGGGRNLEILSHPDPDAPVAAPGPVDEGDQ